MSKEKKLIPELRFPEFVKDGEWKIKSLDKVVDDFIVPMRDKPKKLDGEIPWCRIEDFDGMYLSSSRSNQGVSVETVQEMNLKVYPVNTLLVSCSADLGRCAITQKELVTNQTFIGLVPNTDKIDTVYLYFLMTNSRNELNARSSGTTISYLSRQEFEKFTIVLPKFQEQQKIASCLSSLDELITAHNDKLQDLKDHKKGLMQNLFPQEGEKVPNYRFPEFERDGDWDLPRLEKRMEIFRGASPRPKGDPKYYGGDIPRLMIEDVTRDGKYSTPKIDFLTKEGAAKSRLLKKGSVVLSCSGTRVAIPGILEVDACIHDGWLGFKKLKEVDTEFLYYHFCNLHEKIQGNALAGGVFNNLTTTILKELKLAFPTSKEQQRIASCLSVVDELINSQAERIEQLKLHKKGLMQQLFPKIDN